MFVGGGGDGVVVFVVFCCCCFVFFCFGVFCVWSLLLFVCFVLFCFLFFVVVVVVLGGRGMNVDYSDSLCLMCATNIHPQICDTQMLNQKG